MKYRDDDHDGLPECDHGDENMDDASLYVYSPEMESPDQPAYLILLYEALGDLAEREEDLMSWICFPAQAEKYLKDRKADRENVVKYTIEEA